MEYINQPNPVSLQEKSTLRTLGTLHIVFGCLLGLGSLVSVIYIFIGMAIKNGSFPIQDIRSDFDDSIFIDMEATRSMMGSLFVTLGLIFMVIFAFWSFFTIRSGISMMNQRNYTLCMVMSCIMMISIPLGTTLGIFSVINLNKQSVRQLFGRM